VEPTVLNQIAQCVPPTLLVIIRMFVLKRIAHLEDVKLLRAHPLLTVTTLEPVP
jgi:hypothetical protein